jgi:ATP-dependent Lon protease
VYSQLPVQITDENSKIREFLNNASQLLNDVVYGMEGVKVEILQYIAQAITNPAACGNVIGLEGPPGTGKTTLVRQGLAKALQKPCVCVALGGANDSSFLDGHGYTYEGSECGRIVCGLQEAQAMDPIYFFDEVDKISDTPKGHELAGVLIHLIDPSQNYQFHDKYYSGIDFDLSRATYVFCFNDVNKIDPILRDRMKVIKIPGYTLEEKQMIAEKFLIPKICVQVGVDPGEVSWTKSSLKRLVLLSMEEQGVRTLEQDIKALLLKINTLRFSNAVPYAIKDFKLPFVVDIEALEILQAGPGRMNALATLTHQQQVVINRERRIVNEINLNPVQPKHRVLLSPMPAVTKAMVLRKLDSLGGDSSESEKLKGWVEQMLQIPYGKMSELPVSMSSPLEKIKQFLKGVKQDLDSAVYGMESAKKELLQYVVQRITNPNAPGVVFALCGPPGTGKTTLIKDGFSKALKRPFGFIPLGGAKDASYLKGHSYTYVGSAPGKIVQILQKTKAMDPVIVLDELDKLGDNGANITGALMHIIDPSQNDRFTDLYVGSDVEMDLTKVTFVLSFNDAKSIDPTLLDRIKVINVSGYSDMDKVAIAKEHLIPKILKDIGLGGKDLVWGQGVLKDIIKAYSKGEKGVRGLEQVLRTVITKVNTARFIDDGKLKDVKFPLKIKKTLVRALVGDGFSKASAPFGMYT